MAKAKRGRRNGKRRLLRALGWTDGLGDEQRREIGALLLLIAATLLAYSLVSPSPGWLGTTAREGLRLAVGGAAALVPVLIGFWGLSALLGWRGVFTGPRLAGGFLALALTAAFLHRDVEEAALWPVAAAGGAGGMLGAGLDLLLAKAFGAAGRAIVLYSFSLVAALLITGASATGVLRNCAARLGAGWKRRRGRPAEGKKRRLAATPPVAVPEPPAPAPLSEDPGTVGEAAPPPAVPEEDAPLPDGALPPCAEAGGVPGEAAPPGRDRPAATAGADGGFQQIPLATEALYTLPSPSLLTRRPAGAGPGRRRDAGEKRRILEQTLRNFGVEARVIDVEQGPAVTRFEVQPGPGVKVSRIAGLADDIALSMAAPGVRIVAPIPGKAAMGIEVPNAEVDTVYLRDVLESREFQQSPSALTIAVGQDISGRPIVTSLERMVHLLVAGATGSGKSVFVNTLLASLLFKSGPQDLRLLLIDPKVVELSTYNGIPHLLTPVITDPKRAAGSLKWAIKEMERRYESFAQAGVRDITRYNQGADAGGWKRVPFIVVVIDELADLMMVAPAEVEDAIQRLAQMGRASGIHLVVATQRPSVDVITGVIKANIASRIAFAVSSQVDSRTILDVAGAEKLLGKGDMLFHPMGAPKPVRVQGAYLPEGDLEAVLAHVRRQAEPAYREEVVAEAVEGTGPPEADDDLFDEAVRVVLETGQASVSIIQRRLRVGYTRAGRLIDMMEERGIVGPHQGPKPREVRITAAEYRRVRGDGAGPGDEAV